MMARQVMMDFTSESPILSRVPIGFPPSLLLKDANMFSLCRDGQLWVLRPFMTGVSFQTELSYPMDVTA